MYQHGGHPENDFKRLGITPRQTLDFSVNISPLGMPERIRELWPQLISENERYPTEYGDGIKDFYQSRFKLPRESILAGNGSIDLIYAIPRILGIRRAQIPQPSFHDYLRSCQSAGVSIIHGAIDQVAGCDACFVGNPNNPTGRLIPAEKIVRLAEEHPNTNFFVDEAFIQFVANSDAFSLMQPERLRDNIIVFHSLTKFYALPGLRLGACISTPKRIQFLESKRPPWMVNRVAEKIASELTSCQQYDETLKHIITTERQRVFQELVTTDTYSPINGESNFLLVQWKATNNLDDLLRELLKRGIYVRDCRNFPSLEDNWFRIAIKRRNENNRLLQALDECSTNLR